VLIHSSALLYLVDIRNQLKEFWVAIHVPGSNIADEPALLRSIKKSSYAVQVLVPACTAKLLGWGA